jgi:Acyltransferase family.
MTLFVVFLCIQGVESFSVEWLLSSIFPVVCGKYWFFSAYIFMMLVSPLLNIVIERIKKKTHLAICVVSIVLGILAGDVHIVPQLAMGDGYNVIWFVMLYFIAAFIRKYDVTVPKKWIFIPILAYIATLVAGYFFNTAQCSIVRSTPAIILLIALKDVKTNSARLSKFVTGLSSTMFGVYLIHDSNEMRAYMYRNIFHVDTFYDSKYSFLIMLGFAAATFAVCIAIEEIRLLIDKPLSKVVEKCFLKLKDKMQKKNTNTEATE